jgi:hypothetical protein
MHITVKVLIILLGVIILCFTIRLVEMCKKDETFTEMICNNAFGNLSLSPVSISEQKYEFVRRNVCQGILGKIDRLTSFTEKPVYATMTTLPERMKSPLFERVIDSLMTQQIPIEKVLINIAWEFKGQKYEIPSWLSKYPRVFINRCEDIGPATKLIGGLGLIPQNAIVLVIDDDQIYRNILLGSLLDCWTKNKNSVCAAGLNEDRDAEGFAGYIVSRNLLNGLEGAKPPSSCKNVDDTWLSWYFRKLGLNMVYRKGGSMATINNYTNVIFDNSEGQLHTDTDRIADTRKCKIELNSQYI